MGLLIDPEGNVVGAAMPADLEAKLPPLPAARLWTRHRDMQKHVLWSFEPSSTTLNELTKLLRVELITWRGCTVELDAQAIKASGLTSEGPLPGVVFGEPITLRSIVELLLAPHGLGVVPSTDGKRLLITGQRASAEAESYFQKLRASEINDRLDGRSEAGRQDKPLEIKTETLLNAVKRVSQEFDVPIALDAKAMRANMLDIRAKVTGRIVPGDLRNSLKKLLHPLGLTVEVRHEVVLVTPRGR
jgi:hypothetical protein